MVRDHPQRHVGLLIIAVSNPRGLRHALDERHEDIRLEAGELTLHQGHETLEAHPRIDGGLGQRVQGPVGRPVELHEDQVPDLQISLFRLRVTEGELLAPAQLGPQIQVDL